MFEDDEDLGLDEDFGFTQQSGDSNIVGPSDNCPNKIIKNPHLGRSNQNIFLETNNEQIYPKRGEPTQCSSIKSILSKNVNCSVFNSDKNKHFTTKERQSLEKNKIEVDFGKASTSSNTEFEFKKPSCSKKSGFSELENSQIQEQKTFWEDDDDAFSEDITFDLQQSQVVKKPKEARQKTPTKRKFPGPAGILPESSERTKTFYDNADIESGTSIDIPLTQYPCTQDNSQFSGQLWMRMCSDFSGGRIFLPDRYNIAWIKKHASANIFHNHKAPFLAAVIAHLEQFTSKTPNVIVTLKDTSGQINASLHSDLYEMHKQDLTVGSVVVLRDFSVLTIITSSNTYLTITKRNLLTIYSQASLRSETQAGYTQVIRSTPKITNIQNYNLRDIIEDTANYANFQHNDSIRKNSENFGGMNLILNDDDLQREFMNDDDDYFNERNLIEVESSNLNFNSSAIPHQRSNEYVSNNLLEVQLKENKNINDNSANNNFKVNECLKNMKCKPNLSNLTRSENINRVDVLQNHIILSANNERCQSTLKNPNIISKPLHGNDFINSVNKHFNSENYKATIIQTQSNHTEYDHSGNTTNFEDSLNKAFNNTINLRPVEDRLRSMNTNDIPTLKQKSFCKNQIDSLPKGNEYDDWSKHKRYLNESRLCNNPKNLLNENKLNKIISNDSQLHNSSTKNDTIQRQCNNHTTGQNEFVNKLKNNPKEQFINESKNATVNKNPFEDYNFDDDEDIVFTECDKITSVFNNFNTFSKILPTTSATHLQNKQNCNYENKISEVSVTKRAKLNSEKDDCEGQELKLSPVNVKNKLNKNVDGVCSPKRLAVKKHLEKFKFKKREPETGKENIKGILINNKENLLIAKNDETIGRERIQMVVRGKDDQENTDTVFTRNTERSKKSGINFGNKVTEHLVGKVNDDFITSTQISISCEDEIHSQILEETFDGVDANSFFDDF